MNIVQYTNEKGKRQVAAVKNGMLHPLKGLRSTLELAEHALVERASLASLVKQLAAAKGEDYAAALKERRVLPPVDHPDPAHCIITGTASPIWVRPRRATPCTRSWTRRTPNSPTA